MKVALVLLSVLLPLTVLAQNCDRTSVGYPPINDLGKGFYRGYQGGLYPNGENFAPDQHLTEGLQRALILPHGMWTNGKTVMVSIGMSNTTQESQAFASLLDTFQSKNPNLVFVDCAEGGMDVTKLLGDTAAYWQYVRQRLAAQSLTPSQVSVIWFKEAEASPRDTVFPHHADTLIRYYTAILQGLQKLFPNVQICYLSSRIYAGYATSNLNPEPYAYESGWAVKWLIEKQIAGDTNLSYGGALGEGAKVPWLAWGPYLWADGTTPRSDGLAWICPDDYNTDGTHPSAVGRMKVAERMLDFFSHNVSSIGWFGSAIPAFVLHTPTRDMLMPSVRDTFSWEPVARAARYTVELSQDVFEVYQFTPRAYTVTDTILVLDSLTIPQMQAPVYYVRIYAVDSSGRVIAETGTSFWYRPWRPQIIAPKNFSTNVSVPILQWSTPVAPTDSFYVKLSDDPLLTHALHERIVTASQGQASDTVSGLSSNSTYYWSVMAKARSWSDYYDHPDIWSDTVSFTTGELAEVAESPSTPEFAIDGSDLRYQLSTPSEISVWAVDVLGRKSLLVHGVAAQRGSFRLSKMRRSALFYIIRTATNEYVLRARP